jgi:hypothetical protein
VAARASLCALLVATQSRRGEATNHVSWLRLCVCHAREFVDLSAE